MRAIKRRRGSAAMLFFGVANGLPFCSGGNFRTGSAIALLLFRRFRRRGLYCVTNVFLDGLQLGHHAVSVGGTDALERSGGQFGASTAHFAEQRPRRLAEVGGGALS